MKKIVIPLLLSIPFLSRGQGFQVNLQGQRQQAMGGAASASANDGASMFYNPGAVSFLKNQSISAGVSPVFSKTTFTDNSTSVVSKTTNHTPGFPFTGYMVLGKPGSKFKYGLAAYTPFGSSIHWQDGWTGRFVITHLRLTTVYFQPTVSYKISEKVGIGAGFVYGYGNLNLQSDLPMTDEDGNFTRLALSGKGRGYGFNSGIYYQPTEKLSFGVNYRSPLKLNINKGTATFHVPTSMQANFPSGAFTTKLNLPGVATIASAYKFSKKFTMAFDVSMVGWKCYDTLRYDFEKNTSEVKDMKLPRAYTNTYSYRVGGEYYINENVVARAGLKYLSTPVRDGFVTPEVPDANHFSYSSGIGCRLNAALTADVSFTFENIKRADTNAALQLSGRYKTNLFIPGISLAYSFK